MYLLLRFFLTIFGYDFAFGSMQLSTVLMPLALIGIVTASLVAVFQNNIKRMLAYSSVAQIGYMVLGISFASVDGLTGDDQSGRHEEARATDTIHQQENARAEEDREGQQR